MLVLQGWTLHCPDRVTGDRVLLEGKKEMEGLVIFTKVAQSNGYVPTVEWA